METETAATAFSALGHPGRLAVFRLIARFAPRGARPKDIAEALGMKPNTLSHHLSDLAAAGLVRADRRGRSLLYGIDLDATAALIGYLGLDVARGRPEVLSPLTPDGREGTLPDSGLNVLFLCTGNSARSIFAEALLRDLGKGRFRAHSAGIRPGRAPNPFALDVLRRNGHPVEGLRSKDVAEFQGPDAVTMDFVFTVCDTAAAEECPPWPGQPITGHWGLPDPVKATGTEAERALVFAQTYAALRRRIAAFAELPFDSLSRMSLQARVDAIGARDNGSEQ